MAARAHRHHLSAAAPRYSFARRHFVLHIPFALLYTRHLSRRVAAHEIAAGFHTRRFVFPPAGRGANRARGRFSPATGQAAQLARRPVPVGTVAHDDGTFRKNRARGHDAFRCGRSRLQLWRSAHRSRFMARRDRICRPNIFRFRGVLELRNRRGVVSRISFEG